MIDWLLGPWPWWFSGIMIGLTVPMLYWLAGKAFGISTSLQHIGAICTPNIGFDYLSDHDWRADSWNLMLVGGIVIGGLLGAHFLSSEPLPLLPASFYSLPGILRLLVGGIFVGFGARYAGGCTSGHSITGISNLNVPSMIATAFFFVGGMLVTWGLGSWLLPG
ncbi:MAG: YeeE/YedE family protein [Anaerolineales bacterium]|nr:YeeE/YedE family protein [Anaerolineales bacterium]MCB9128498.1 YeeE/YedE family protein [Ardenticatenales bacterium]